MSGRIARNSALRCRNSTPPAVGHHELPSRLDVLCNLRSRKPHWVSLGAAANHDDSGAGSAMGCLHGRGADETANEISRVVTLTRTCGHAPEPQIDGEAVDIECSHPQPMTPTSEQRPG